MMEKHKSNALVGWSIAALLAILILLKAMSVQHQEYVDEISLLEDKIADYEDYIVALGSAYDSLLVEEIELIERHDEEILSIDTLSVDSLRGYFASRYGFFDVLYTDSVEVDSTRH